MVTRNESKNIAAKNSTYNVDNTEDTTGPPHGKFIVKDHTNSIGDNDYKNTMNHQGIIALITVIELANESQAFRAHK